jgi:ribonucleoside-diphosphate reductase alpha chain
LGKEKGPFPNVIYSKWKNSKEQPRNVSTNTLPPSSGNAVIFGTSYSIEPYYALAYYQNVLGGMRIKNVNEKLAKLLNKEGVNIDNLFEKIFENHGSLQNIEEIPAHIKRLFLTAHEIPWKDHLAMQAAWQKHIDNAISKTINMSSSETVETVEKVYRMAWEMGCKGVTIYRDNSKLAQVIEFGDNSNHAPRPPKIQKTMRELRGGDDCPECGEKLLSTEGCIKCLCCNFSLCQL